MGIITGYLCLVCCLLLLLKLPAKKLAPKRVDRILSRLHKPVGFLFLCLTVLHLVLVFPVLKTRAITVWLSGFVLLALILLITLLSCRKKKPARPLAVHLALSAVILLFATAHMVVCFMDFRSYQRSVESITLDDLNVSDIADGEYIGSHDVGYISAKVSVSVKGGRITSITLLRHDNERGEAGEAVLDSILAAQRVDVDCISGATNSSKVIRKAVSNALRQGK